MNLIAKKEFPFNYTFSDRYHSIYLDLERLDAKMFIDSKYNGCVSISITKKNGFKRKNIDLKYAFEIISDFIENASLFLEKNYELFSNDYLKRDIVKFIEINNLKIEDKDVQFIKNKFHNLKMFKTENCTYYSNCNIGTLDAELADYSSKIYSLDSLNGSNSKVIKLIRTKFGRMNKNFLHLNCVVLELKNVELDYEKFFLTTDAKNLRSLIIYRYSKILSKLNHEDLLFVSGFYNLEKISIEGIVHSYDQIRKLDRLREIDSLYCDNIEELTKIKILREKYVNSLSKKQNFDIANYLMHQGVYIQKDHLDYYNKIYVPKIERIKWLDKINTNDLINIKNELLKIDSLLPEARRNISKEIRESNMFDEAYNLNYNIEKTDDNYCLESSKPIPFDDVGSGINYYVKSKKIRLLK